MHILHTCNLCACSSILIKYFNINFIDTEKLILQVQVNHHEFLKNRCVLFSFYKLGQLRYVIAVGCPAIQHGVAMELPSNPVLRILFLI